MALLESSPGPLPRSDRVIARLDPDRTIVWIRGEQDSATVPALTETLVVAVALNHTDVVVDLSDVQFMDASTIGVIVRTRNSLRQRSRSLKLRSPSPAARRVLEICGLVDLIDAG